MYALDFFGIFGQCESQILPLQACSSRERGQREVCCTTDSCVSSCSVCFSDGVWWWIRRLCSTYIAILCVFLFTGLIVVVFDCLCFDSVWVVWSKVTGALRVKYSGLPIYAAVYANPGGGNATGIRFWMVWEDLFVIFCLPKEPFRNF